MTKKILIACDEPGTRIMLWAMLRHSGYSVERAETGLDALTMLAEAHSDILIVDLAAAAMDSYDLCRRVRTNISKTQLPIVILTSSRDSESVVKSRDVGANQVVSKQPLYFTDLLNTLGKLLEPSRR